MVCKGLCAQHKARRGREGTRYAAGQKRCQVCQTFLWWKGTNCPCCGMRLRTKPKGTRERKALLNHPSRFAGLEAEEEAILAPRSHVKVKGVA